jgi:hypothetical protein
VMKVAEKNSTGPRGLSPPDESQWSAL